jgi:hypothetical protein
MFCIENVEYSFVLRRDSLPNIFRKPNCKGCLLSAARYPLGTYSSRNRRVVRQSGFLRLNYAALKNFAWVLIITSSFNRLKLWEIFFCFYPR